MGYLSHGILTINKIKVHARILYSEKAGISYGGEKRCVKNALYKIRTLFSYDSEN